MNEFTTACPRNCYSTCSFKVTLKDGQLTSIESHKDNLATTEGPCLKGLSYIERVYSPDRILYPLKKEVNGNFSRVSWEEAVSVISEKLISLKNDHGAKSVLYYCGSGTKGLLNSVSTNFWKLYGGCTTTYGDLCWPSGLEATRLMLGENKHNSPWDLENAGTIIFWGKNAAETNIHQMVFADRVKANDGKVIVIDPRRTQTSERADLLIQPRPGTDGALALAIANLIIEKKNTDEQFIRKYVHGYDEFREMVKKYDTELVSEITDVPPEYIVRVAEIISRKKPVTICGGFGMQRYSNSGQTMRAIISILAITGNIGKPGAGWQFANLQSHIFDEVKDPVASFPPEKESDGIRVSISTAELGKGILESKDPGLKMAWIERGNPVTQNPETHTVLEALRSLDLIIVVEQFMTDTAMEADIILPAKSMFEQSDVINAYWHPYIQLKQKVIDPPGEVKPESEIYYYLAKAIGLTDGELEGSIPLPGDGNIDNFLEEKLKPFPELSLNRLKAGPVIAPGTEDIAWKDLEFGTPSGKIELYSKETRKRWGLDELPVYTETIENIRRNSSPEYPLYMMTPNTKDRIHSQFNNIEMIKQVSPEPVAQINPDDASKRSIEHGDMIRLFNERGELKVRSVLDYSLKQGCVSLTNGWWIAQGGTVNFLSFGRETDMGHGAAFHENLVEIEKVE